MRDLNMYEAVIDDTGGGGGADVGADPEGAVEASGVAEAVVPETAAETAPSWAPPQDQWEQMQQRLDYLAQAVTPQQPDPGPSLPGFDSVIREDEYGNTIIDPAALQQYLDQNIEAGVNARMAPVQPVLDQTIADRGEQVIAERFGALQTEVGAFDTAVARQIAEGLASQGSDPNEAIRQAAILAHNHDKTIREAAIEEYKATLANIGNAPREPGVAGAGVSRIEPRSGADGYKDVEKNFLERLGVG